MGQYNKLMEERHVFNNREGTELRSRWNSAWALAVPLAVASIAAACGDAEAQPAGELKLAALSSYQAGFDKLIAAFEAEYPDIEIQATYYEAGQAYATAIPTQFAGGSGTDLVFVLAGQARPYSVTPFAAAGYLADLSGASWVSSMYEPTKSLYEYDGAVRARDLGIAPLALLSYDKAYFAEHDVAIPTTFDELLSVCEQIAAEGTIPIAWAGGSAVVNANNTATLAGSTVLAEDPDWLAKRAAGEVTFAESEGWRRAVQHLADMIEGGCFSPGASGAPLAAMVTEFATGQSAMMFTSGILNGMVLQQTPDLDIGVFPPPGDVPEDTRVIVQPSGGMAIWTEAASAEAANLFLDFISQEDQAAVFARASQVISPAEATAGNLPGVYADLKSYFDNGQILSDPTAIWPNTDMNSNFGESLQGLFTGQKTVDEVLADMDTFYDRQ
jgi:raffinose/stachyose/melibiose transport system substrate-binding protein